jgi:hypothetical protein
VFSLGFSLVLFAATVLMVVGLAMWTARVRRNAELISPRPHRLTRRFAAGCWFVPVANAWLPKVVLDDVWLASDPATRYLPPGHGPRSSREVTLWWASLVLSGVVWLVVTIVAGGLTVIHDVADYASAATGVAVGNTVLLLIAVVGLGFGARMVRRIGEWQEPRVGAASAPVVGRPGLRSVSGLGATVLVLMVIWLGCALATVFGLASMIYAYDWFWSGLVMYLFGRIASVLVMMAAGVLLMVWLYRASHNARLVAPSAPMLPTWTVFAWLIPFANLVLPPRVLFDVLRAGARRGGRAVDLAEVAGWWLAWTGAWVVFLALWFGLIGAGGQTFFTWMWGRDGLLGGVGGAARRDRRDRRTPAAGIGRAVSHSFGSVTGGELVVHTVLARSRPKVTFRRRVSR